MPFYHYTKSDGIKGILQVGFIRASDDNAKDAVYGKGVYLTRHPPDTDVAVLLHNNWDGSPQFYLSRLENLEYCIEFSERNLPDARKEPDSRDVWRVAHDINLSKVPFRLWKLNIRVHQSP